MRKQIADTYLYGLQKYLDSVGELPTRGEKAFIKAIVDQIKLTSGISVPAQALYKNTNLRAMINQRCEQQGIEGIRERKIIDAGEDNETTQTFRKYLDQVKKLPERNGKVNVAQIAKETGIKKSDLYRGNCRDLLNDTCKAQNLIGILAKEDYSKQIEDREKMRLERENIKLKRKNAALYAEVHDLRRQLKKYQKIELMMKRGQQVIL